MVLQWGIETGVWLYESYAWTLTLADRRVEAWPLMASPLPTAALTALYLLTVATLPSLLAHRPPASLRSLLILYNCAMTALNAYIFQQLLVHALSRNYNWSCQPVDYSDNEDEVAIASALWWFYFSKLLEFADTIFFIVRGKMRQVTFLHVYHHSTMFCFWWIGIKWVAGGSSFLGAFMNSAVHVLMYSYYALSAAFPRSNFWWKKYLTVLQLIQFMVAMTQAIRGLTSDPPCPFPRWMGYTLIGYMVSFIFLFSNFFLHAYCHPKPKAVNGARAENGYGRPKLRTGTAEKANRPVHDNHTKAE